MRWLSRFALLLYLSLLCTPQAFAVHDARLSPLADTQFHALTPELPQCAAATEQGSTDDPQQALLLSHLSAFSLTNYNSAGHPAEAHTFLCLTLQQARAPPQSASH